jgi:STE24 endopeptidase
MFGSFALLLVLFGFLGRWEPVAILAWLACGAAVFTRGGERFAVQAALGFRTPTADQRAGLAHVWTAALTRAGYGPEAVDLYVQRSAAINAYAAGGRSVAVTTGALRDFLAHRLGEGPMTAVLVHELGHHDTGGAGSLAMLWLTMPWRMASRFVIGLCYGLSGRRQPVALLGVVALAAVGIAVGQAVQQDHWMTAIVLAGLGLCAVVCPLADAFAARRAEFAADQFAADLGLGPQLAAALKQLAKDSPQPRRWLEKLASRHPPIERRLKVLAD